MMVEKKAGKRLSAARKAAPEAVREREERRAAAAEAVARYRERRQNLGYVAISFWVPGFLRPGIRRMVNDYVNEQLALQEAQRTGEIDAFDDDDAPLTADAPARARARSSDKPVARRRG